MPRGAKLERPTKPGRITATVAVTTPTTTTATATTATQEVGEETSAPSIECFASPSVWQGGGSWTTDDFLSAHEEVVSSGKRNYEGCKIPIPTPIRYDRMKDLLGDSVSPKEERVLSLLKFGMPLDCKAEYGVRRRQKNHFSAVSFEEEVDNYLSKGKQCHAILAPLMNPQF